MAERDGDVVLVFDVIACGEARNVAEIHGMVVLWTIIHQLMACLTHRLVCYKIRYIPTKPHDRI